MAVYNTSVPVVELVEADDEKGAIVKLEAALRQAGFEPYEGGEHSAFLSEPDAQDARIR
jgi:hypothetical protein